MDPVDLGVGRRCFVSCDRTPLARHATKSIMGGHNGLTKRLRIADIE
jgi:hypothetical protein